MAYLVDDHAADLFREEGLRVEGNRIPISGMPNVGMAVHGSEGIWLEDLECRSSLPGLYAAGDAAGSRQQGAIYCNWGFAILGAAVTGARAGVGAGRFAAGAPLPEIGEEAAQRAIEAIGAPLRRSGGYGPRWVTQSLLSTVVPWYVLGAKHAERLQAALTLVDFVRDHLVPRLYARDVHELRLAHEARNLVLNAEMKLRASLFRTESRGRHWREDFPRRDDPGWLAWTVLRQGGDGEMELSRHPIPDGWWPDLAAPYESRYPFRFPGDEALAESRPPAASALGGAS
jgi:succinate dehydrogenase/fumarate reductase flavoprotein subunit